MPYLFPELLPTAGTPAASAKCLVPMIADGPIRDVVGNTLGRPNFGYYAKGTGHYGKVVAGGFSAGSFAGDCYTQGPGAGPIVFPGRGSAAFPRTVWGVFRVREFPAIIGDLKAMFFGIGIGNAGSGLGFKVVNLGDGTIGVGDFWNGNFWGPEINIVRNRWYLMALTYLNSSSRLLQVYDIASGTYLTPQSTGSAYTSGGTGLYDTDDAILGNIDAMFDCRIVGMNEVTFDPTVNNYFAQHVTNHFSGVGGAAYSPSGGLAAPVVTWKDSTMTTVEVHSNRPSGGAANSYQYRLHRLPATDTTPSAATRVTGLQDSPLLVDTTATTAFAAYVVEVTDGTTTVYSTQVYGHAMPLQDAKFGIIGDSRGYWGSRLAANLRAGGRMASIQTLSYGGSAYYQPSVYFSWQPNLTQDPVNGQSGTFLLQNAIDSMDEAGIPNVIIDLLANDIAAGVAGPTFSANAARVINYCVSRGKKVYLNAAFVRSNAVAYSDAVARLAALADGVDVFFNSVDALAISNGFDVFTIDGLHLNDQAGQFPATGFQKFLEASSTSGGGFFSNSLSGGFQ